jgi:hypothetical protein
VVDADDVLKGAREGDLGLDRTAVLFVLLLRVRLATLLLLAIQSENELHLNVKTERKCLSHEH